MKTFFGSVFFIVAFLFTNELNAQSRYCDELITQGDTVICRDFVGKRKLPFREHYYVKGRRVFTRDWHRKKNGEYDWRQQISKGAFAKENGPACAYYSNGKIKATTFFAHGKKVGPCKGYYPSGALEQTCERHIQGRMDGVNTHFYENGQIKARARWEKGRLREIIQYKDEQGNDLPIGTFKEGNGTWHWLKKDKTTVVYTYKNGKQVKKKPLK